MVQSPEAVKDVVGPYEPGGQGFKSPLTLPLGQKCPKLQSSGGIPSSADSALETPVASRQNLPAGQRVQAVTSTCPRLSLKVPAGHGCSVDFDEPCGQ